MIEDQLPLDGLPPLVQAIVPSMTRSGAPAIGTDGYGRFWFAEPGRQQRVVAAHILAWEFAQPLGSIIPGGTYRLHECNTTLCVHVGPGHVITGTQRENIRYADPLGHRHGRRPVSTEGPAETARRIQDRHRPSAPGVLAVEQTWSLF